MRCQQLFVDAAERIVESPTRDSQLNAIPSPGELFVFDTSDDVAIEWLFVRKHPNDANLVLFVPTDDFPIVGSADVPLSPEVSRPLTARCGESLWVTPRICRTHLRVASIPEQALSLVRQRLADLARGRVQAGQDVHAEADPEYRHWIALVQTERERLQSRADQMQESTSKAIPFAQLESRPSLEPPKKGKGKK